jgi:hypothetical protein
MNAILEALAHDQNVSADLRAVMSPDTRLAVYKRGLQTFNWHFAFCDDGVNYQRHLDRFDELEAEARVVDPDWRLWNEFAPIKFRNGHKALS